MLGTGILKGLYITAKNLVGSYTNKAQRLTTIQYPEERAHIPQNYRNFPFLVHDAEHNAAPADAVDRLRCIACTLCERECPPQCIYIVKEKVGSKVRPKVFDIDISVCMGCGICVEVCPNEAIKMDQVFEVAVGERFATLLLHREQLAKSNQHYHDIHPADADRSDAALAEKARKLKDAADRAAAAKAAAEAKAATAAANAAV